MPLRVGFDLDGTVADMYSALHREAVKLFGEEVLRKATPKAKKPQEIRSEQSGKSPQSEPKDEETTNIAMAELHLTAKQQMQLWEHVKKIENFWTTLSELEPGIISRIARTSLERR